MEIKTQKVEELDRREDPGQQEAGKGRSHPTSRCSLGTFSLFQRYFATSFSEQSLRENLLLVVNKKFFLPQKPSFKFPTQTVILKNIFHWA